LDGINRIHRMGSDVEGSRTEGRMSLGLLAPRGPLGRPRALGVVTHRGRFIQAG